MSEAPLFITVKPKPPTARALWLTVLIVTLLGLLASFFDHPGRIMILGVSSLASLGLAAAGTLTLFFAVGRKSGDRGGVRDFLIILLFAIVVPAFVSSVIAGVGVVGDGLAKADVRKGWDHYTAASVADRKAMLAEMDNYNPSELITPAVLSKDPGFRKTRSRLTEGGEMIARYRALDLRRQQEGRTIIGKIKSPSSRVRALGRYNKELAVRRPAEDSVWDLSADVYVKSEAVLDALQRTRPEMTGGKFLFRSQAGMDAYDRATDALNSVVEQRARQDRSNAEWERGRSI